jgi:hypothetical protein
MTSISKTLPLAALALAALTAAPALATPCAEHIATIERRLQSEGAAMVTGGVANPQAQGSPRAPGPAPGPATTGDPGPNEARIAAAREAIAKAKDFERQGNQAACDDAMTEAKRLIGALP